MRDHPKEIEGFLTLDDVSIVPAFSEVLLKEVDISTQVTLTIQWTIPLL
jgi:IMP dehydrogenase